MNKIELTILTRGATLANLSFATTRKTQPLLNTDRALNRMVPRPPRLPDPSDTFCASTASALRRMKKQRRIPSTARRASSNSKLSLERDRDQAQNAAALAQEDITRTITVSMARIGLREHRSRESTCDRPSDLLGRACHHGPPFLSPGKRSSISRDEMPCASTEGRLHRKADVWKRFRCADGSTRQGGAVNLTTVPAMKTSLDLASCIIDPARTYGYVTALRPDKAYDLRYVFRRESSLG